MSKYQAYDVSVDHVKQTHTGTDVVWILLIYGKVEEAEKELVRLLSLTSAERRSLSFSKTFLKRVCRCLGYRRNKSLLTSLTEVSEKERAFRYLSNLDVGHSTNLNILADVLQFSGDVQQNEKVMRSVVYQLKKAGYRLHTADYGTVVTIAEKPLTQQKK